jgi:hypothetical protein
MAGRACIYCGARGAKLTNERVIPKWVGKLLGVENEKVRHASRRAPALDIEPLEWEANGVDVTANTVCGRCNSGWMHDLEEAVRSLLGGLITGGQSGLSERRRRTLVRWLVKTVAAQQHAEPADARIVPGHHARAAYNDTTHRGRFQVWAAGNDHDAGIALGARDVELGLRDGTARASWMHLLVLQRISLITLDLGDTASAALARSTGSWGLQI